MNYKQIRDWTFYIHRYLGLIVALLSIIIGLTGSLLVFEREIDQFLVRQQFGQVIPQGQRAPIESVVETVKTAYASQPELKLSSAIAFPDAHLPYVVRLESLDEKRTQVFVNPYTGVIMGSREWERTLIGFTFKLHYELLAGKIGEIIIGIAALFLFILSITGIMALLNQNMNHAIASSLRAHSARSATEPYLR